MAYDRADWHYGADDFPADLGPESGGTHIGMFLAWALCRGLEGSVHREGSSVAAVEAIRARRMTGTEFLFRQCDEKFWEEDLSAEGNAFAKAYFVARGRDGYLADYEKTLLGGQASLYRVKDSWENFDRIASVIDRRFESWKRRATRPWWKFWS